MRAWRYSTAWLAAAGLALGAGAGAPALASVGDDERVFRQDALGHAAAIASAYRRLEEHILLGSTAITSWSGSVPPKTMGWLDAWTDRGVRARYCGDVLLVYLEPAELKGVREDHRSVHAAPFAYVPAVGDARLPTLHWLEAGVAQGNPKAGRPTVLLPGCMTGSGDPLPSGRAALAGGVADPFVNLTEGLSHELRTEACPAGFHGPGRRFARGIKEQKDGRGDPVPGTKVEGTWRLVADACRADFSEWEQYTVVCSWNAGPPHDREMFGEEIWRRLKTVTAAGTSYGTPEFVSTSCWTEVAALEPTPTISESARTQTVSVLCGTGYTGTRRYSRTVTTRSTQFPWDAAPVVTERATPWALASSSCQAVVVDDDDDPPAETDDDGPDEDEDDEGEDKKEDEDEKDDDDSEEDEDDEHEPVKDDGGGEPGTFTAKFEESRTRSCSTLGGGYSGTYTESRKVTQRYQAGVLVSTTHTEWSGSTAGCKKFNPPGPSSPGGGECSPSNVPDGSPGVSDTCPDMDPSIAAAVAAVSGNGNGGSGGGCYFTTAVVEQRGDEPDDGPTLTALRDFRDSYMMETPLRRWMVRAYYRIAPLVVRDLPAGDPSWQPMGAHIDRSVALIREGRLDAAFRAYVTGSSRLMLRWWLLRAGKAFS